jgi:membrane protein YqaA with SNARE-associated domain
MRPSTIYSAVGVLTALELVSVASTVPPDLVVAAVSLGWLEQAVETATGWLGLVVVWVYSFLIAVVLPLPSEVVLLAPLELGLPSWSHYALIVGVSGLGKATGSLLAFRLGRETATSGPVIRALERSRFDVMAWSERKTVQIARRFGYVGLALALTVPGFPDTISIYAFSVLERDYLKFALAAFAGSVGRLVVVLGAGAAYLSI